MEVQIVLNDVVRIMDLPFTDELLQQQEQAVQQQSDHIQYQSNEHIITMSDDEIVQNSGEIITSDSTDLIPWTNELKLALANVKFSNYSSNSGGETSGSESNMINNNRKRKFWEEQEPTPNKLSISNQQQMMDDCLPGNKMVSAPFRNKEERRELSRDSVGSRMNSWPVEDIAENLAADLDGGLAGLGVDISSNSYSMSVHPVSGGVTSIGGPDSPVQTGTGGNTSQLHHLLQQHGYQNIATTTASQLDSSGVGSGVGPLVVLNHIKGYPNQSANSSGSTGSTTVSPTVTVAPSNQNQDSVSDNNIDCRFQYVLAAATSIATRVNEETLTYLNQGQSYEIKLKKLGELSAYRGKILKSIIRICFHERRLQYMEREQMAAWQASRPGDRIVEVDVPLSYGIFDVVQDQFLLNTVEFLWDPTKEVGVYIKVNCISTEFTPKKHGGEKGVPFRIQVETYLQTEGAMKRLHAAACQIKVFKLKGADRKHKQDRVKILRRPPPEQDKFQPSYECTVLNDLSSDAIFPAPQPPSAISPTGGSGYDSSDAHGPQGRQNNSAGPLVTPKQERQVPALPAPPVHNDPSIQEPPLYLQHLAAEATAQQTSQWLQSNRFGSYLRTFASFSGADILRLSRDDLIQICGLADGIRLYNALHSKAIAPRLTMYLCLEQNNVYHALYMDNLSCGEMTGKLAHLMGITSEQIHDIYIQGPGGIHILITDEVVRNIKDEAMFSIEILQDQSGERYRLLLKPSPN